jgi:RNA polymerase sigma factor (sigma-70 family)
MPRARHNHPAPKTALFLKRLSANSPSDIHAFYALAKAAHISKSHALHIAWRAGYGFKGGKTRHLDASGFLPKTLTPLARQYATQLPHILKQYEHFFLALTKEARKKGVPYEMLKDAQVDASLAALNKYDPSKGTLSSYVTRAWKLPITAAAGRFFRLKQLNRPAEHARATPDRRLGKRRLGYSPAGKYSDELPARNPTPFEINALHDERGDLQRAIATLSDVEQRVLRHRFKLDGHEWLTHKELAKQIGKTASGTHFIEQRALRKLREALDRDAPMEWLKE